MYNRHSLFFPSLQFDSFLDSTSNEQAAWAAKRMRRTRWYAMRLREIYDERTLTCLIQLYLVCGKDLGFTAELGRDRRYYARGIESGKPAWRAGMRDGFRLMGFVLRPTTKRGQDQMKKWTESSVHELTSFSGSKRKDIIAVKINFGNATPPWQLKGIWKDRDNAINKKKVCAECMVL